MKNEITTQEAIENVRELGRVFVDSLLAIGEKPIVTSELMNGFVAYDQLKLKGELPYLDESIEIVLNKVYENVLDKIEKDTIKIGY